MSQQSLPIVPHAELRVPQGGFDVVAAFGAGPSGDVAVLWATPPEAERLRPLAGPHVTRTATPNPTVGPPASCWAARYDADGRLVWATPLEVPLSFPHIQPFSDGVLVVGSRASSAHGGDRNALLYDGDGLVALAACVGDGISHVQADAAGRVWLGFFDEGVFGNYGWGLPGYPDPLGAPGVVAVDSNLEQVWRHDRNLFAIYDCYALNVDGDTVWMSVYDQFPLAAVASGIEHTFSCASSNLAGAWGVLASGERVCLLGSYDFPDVAYTAVLRDGALCHVTQTPIGWPHLPGPRWVSCRSGTLHVVQAGIWFHGAITS